MLSENERQLFLELYKRVTGITEDREERCPLQDAAVAADIFFQNANGVLDSYKMAGEVKLVFDLL